MKLKKDIRSLSLKELCSFFEFNNYPAFRGNQVYNWLWNKSCFSFDEMTNISLELREVLKKDFVINHIKIDEIQKSNDGTIKNAVKLFDDLLVESVLIPVKNRTTACVSSQVGCSLDCEFCATSKLKRIRNLNPDEIFDQVSTINLQSKLYYNRPRSNIVFMGMGEPLLNYKSVLESINLITTEKGLGMSPKRITVSTAGIAKMIKKLGDDGVRFNLAISLHSASDSKRDIIMPINKKINLEELRESVRYFYDKTGGRVTYEYILFKDLNDSIEDAQKLVQFTKAGPCKINLIEYNTVEGLPYERSSNRVTEQFMKYLEERNILVTLRKSKGKDINAACGQLVNKLK